MTPGSPFASPRILPSTSYHSIVLCVCDGDTGATSFVTSQKIRRPVSSRSEFVIGPSEFSCVHTISWMSLGHSRLSTVGTHVSPSPTTTPPVFSFAASMMPTEWGSPVISYLHFVGSLCASQRRTRKLSIDCCSSLFGLMNTSLGSGHMPSTLLIGGREL